MKIAICDDEKYIRDFIAKSISDEITDAIVKCYESAENLLEAAYNPDILFPISSQQIHSI